MGKQPVSADHHTIMKAALLDLGDTAAGDADDMVLVRVIRIRTKGVTAFPSESRDTEKNPAFGQSFEIAINSGKAVSAEPVKQMFVNIPGRKRSDAV
jgi:hypothetical protein